MIRNILVPVDGSPFAERALPEAVAHARRHGATLHLAMVHVRHSPMTTEMALITRIEKYEYDLRQAEANYLHALADRLNAESGVQVRVHLLTGDVVPQLKHAAHELPADLVIVTTHGRGGIERAWLGSVADALLRHLDMPVLVIRPGASERSADEDTGRFRHVVVALDGSERAERALAPALVLAGDALERVTLLRVVSPPTAVASTYLPHAARLTQEQLQHRVDAAAAYVARARGHAAVAVRVESSVAVEPSEAVGILRFAREHDADLIAMGAHGRSPVMRMLLGSVTDRVVRTSPVPVLVC